MARKTPDGRWIFSAGEVGYFTVCPVAWQLRHIKKVNEPVKPPSISEGAKAHSDWAKRFDDAQELYQLVRKVLLLFAAAIIIYVLSNQL